MMWTVDDAGDLVNLGHMECVTVAPITEEDSRPTPQDTHELLALTPEGTSYRLAFGSETQCLAVRQALKMRLEQKGEIG